MFHLIKIYYKRVNILINKNSLFSQQIIPVPSLYYTFIALVHT